MTETSDATPDYDAMARQLGAIEDPVELLEQSYIALTKLLRRAEDSELLDQLSVMLGEIVGGLPLDAPERDLRRHTRTAARRCLDILEAARERRLPRAGDEAQARPAAAAAAVLPAAAGETDGPIATDDEDEDQTPPEDGDDARRQRDLEYSLPPQLAHLLKHIEYDQPNPPEPAGGFASFDDLCLAALNYRIDRVLTFFHKSNPAVVRPLPPPFLLSPAFAERFKKAVATLIFPKIRTSRQLRLLASNVDIASATTESFWQGMNESMRRLLQLTWNTAWNDIRLIAEMRGEERVMMVKEEVKSLRTLLQPPTPDAYDLPHVANPEIELFRSLLSTTTDWWPALSEFWWVCHTLYEQEWDPRVFQQQAREGALRDTLLGGFDEFPEPWHDFLVLMLHRVFPRIGTRFLERFAYNLGQNEEARERRMPYLMRAVKQARSHPDIRRLEHQDEEAWRQQVKALHDHFKGLKPKTD